MQYIIKRNLINIERFYMAMRNYKQNIIKNSDFTPKGTPKGAKSRQNIEYNKKYDTNALRY